MRGTVLTAMLAAAPLLANPEMTVDLPGGATMDFVWIEPGTFLMGSPDSEEGRSDREGPQHDVTITRGFFLGKYEITQGQWKSVTGTTPWSDERRARESDDNAASYIYWDDLESLISVLNADAGAGTYRLPTEAEWEYACRAGTTTRWSFGDDEGGLHDYAWCSNPLPGPVGTKLPNPWGLFDMHGNVSEWCSDKIGDYSSAAQVDPQGDAWGPHIVARGGSYFHRARDTRSASRSTGSDGIAFILGARLLRTGPDPTAVTPEGWGEVKARAQP